MLRQSGGDFGPPHEQPDLTHNVAEDQTRLARTRIALRRDLVSVRAAAPALLQLAELWRLGAVKQEAAVRALVNWGGP